MPWFSAFIYQHWTICKAASSSRWFDSSINIRIRITIWRPCSWIWCHDCGQSWRHWLHCQLVNSIWSCCLLIHHNCRTCLLRRDRVSRHRYFRRRVYESRWMLKGLLWIRFIYEGLWWDLCQFGWTSNRCDFLLLLVGIALLGSILSQSSFCYLASDDHWWLGLGVGNSSRVIRFLMIWLLLSNLLPFTAYRGSAIKELYSSNLSCISFKRVILFIVYYSL